MPGSYNKGSRPSVDRRRQLFRAKLANGKKQQALVPALAAKQKLMKNSIETGVLSKATKTQLSRRQKKTLRNIFKASGMAVDKKAAHAEALAEAAAPKSVTVQIREGGPSLTFSMTLGVSAEGTEIGAPQ